MPSNFPIPPGFMVVHGNRLEELRSLAVSWMQRYPLAPLENETILVQSNGIAQWLKLALAADPRGPGAEAGGCGIAAAIDVQLPARFLWQAYRSVLGREAIPDTSAFDRVGLTWRLMRLLPTLLGEELFAPLRRFLADDHGARKLYQLADRLADLFDQYQVYRADWLHDWAAGRDRLRTSRRGEVSLAMSERWQPALWRALLADQGAAGMTQSRAGVHRAFLERAHAMPAAPAGLARRVIVFGISSMPAQSLEALAALSRFSQILLCVHNPCRYHWIDIVADQDLLRHAYRRQQHKHGLPPQIDAADLHRHGHPLLASWGKQGRDYINLLDSHDMPERYREHFAALGDNRIDLFVEPPATTLLSQLQDDILNLRSLDETRDHWPEVEPNDASVQFHLAHSAQREVEILHDQLLRRFSTDTALRPRDVIVMVPDIDAYAPHIQAVFGQIDGSDSRYIPYTLADQGRRGRDPLLIAAEYLLHLPESRFAVSEILDLLHVPAVRKRFGLALSDLPTLRRWMEGAGIRWGMDAAQRATLGLPDDLQRNTWRFGLRRMLLGYAVGDGQDFAGIEPYDEIGGLEAGLVGPLVALLDTMEATRREFAQAAPPARWGQRLHAMLQAFFDTDSDADEALLGRLAQLLEDWLAACENAGLTEPLPLVVVREAWLAQVDESRLNQRFLAGSVNFCTLMPMRAIPFKVVCLLGMNDGDYPRSQPPLDFDLMGADYRPGDRSRREDDRYLLLEALLSARDALHISWIGRSVRDNTEKPPSVLIGQLRDHLAAGWKLAGDGDGEALLAAVTQVHPLQPFSARYFFPEPAVRPLFSYAREWAALHGAAGNATTDAASVPQPAIADTLELEELKRFLRDPLRYYFNHRLKVFFDDAERPPDDEEPFELDGLQRYGVSEQLLNAAMQAPSAELAAQSLAQTSLRLQRSGALPHAGFGDTQLAELIEPLHDVLERHRRQLAAWPTAVPYPLPVDLELQDVRLEGWLDGLRTNAPGCYLALQVIPAALLGKGSLKWHRLIRPWVQHLAANATGVALSTAVLGTDMTLTLPPIEPSQALALLDDLVAAWKAGMNSPLPVAVQSAFACLAASQAGGNARAEAAKAYEDGFNVPGEVSRNAYLARQYPRFDDIWCEGAFAEWAQRLYGPLHEAGRQALAAAKADKAGRAS